LVVLLSQTEAMSFNELQIPSCSEKEAITRAFVKDLKALTVYDKAKNKFFPVICCVCDSMPLKTNWRCFVKISDAVNLFQQSNMELSFLKDVYASEELLKQYSYKHKALRAFTLSPATYINEKKELLMCKQCHSELLANKNVKIGGHEHKLCHPPAQAIASGYVIGDAPVALTELNDVEISIISRVRIYCQSWIFFGGCHQHIKGWQTFFKNRPTDNVGNLMQLVDAGMEKIIVVVLCGPFTTTQRALIMESTAVNPKKVINAWRWLKANNYRYKDDDLPNIDDIPLPQIIDEQK
jgi:hypothetical protein